MRWLFASFLLLTACTNKKSDKAHYEEGQVLKTSKKFTIPQKLKERIHKDYLEFFRDLEPSNLDKDGDLVAQLPREFLEVDMYLRQLNDGTLESNRIFRSPRGGGLIDLADTVIGEKGSFFVNYKVRNSQAPDEDLSNLRVYYLSEIKAKEVEKVTYGSGCGSLVDISNTISDAIRVNAKNDRYIHTMAGTYIFVSYAYEKILLAALRIKDSSITGFECPGKS